MDTQANCAVPFYIRDLSILEFWYPSTVLLTWWAWWTPTRRTWVWVSSRSWWQTGKPGMLQSMGSQRVGHNWATELSLLPNTLWILRDSCALNGLEVEWMLWDTHFRVQGIERRIKMFRSSEQKNQIKQQVLLDFSHSLEETEWDKKEKGDRKRFKAVLRTDRQ